MDSKIECLECHKLYNSITNTHLARHGLTELTYRKKYGDVSLRSQQYLEKLRKRPSYERTQVWRERASKQKKGSLNPRYRNGNPLKNKGYGGRWQYYYRIEALRRDEFQCCHCQMTQEEHYIKYGSSLHVHHIDRAENPSSKNHLLDNLVTLCKRCHIIEDNRLYESKKHPKDPRTGQFVRHYDYIG